MTYPSQYETGLVLKDGSKINLRPIKQEDTGRWLAFVNKLSLDTKYLRFLHQVKELGLDDAIRFCTVDYTNNFAFVADVSQGKHRDIVAIGRYYRLPDGLSAEIAIAVEDTWQGRGIGTALLLRLAGVARDNGITRFEADVLAENEKMITIFKNCGFSISQKLEAGVYHVTFPV